MSDQGPPKPRDGPGWRVSLALASLGVIAISLAVIAAVLVWFVFVGSEQFLEWGWEMHAAVELLAENLGEVEV